MNCVICLDGEITHVFKPCGHLACCNQCYADLKASGRSRCPVCRQDIIETFRVYVVTEEERQQITDSRIKDLKHLSSQVEQEQKVLTQKQKEAEKTQMQLERQQALVLADRERKKVLLHMAPTDSLKEPTKARAQALKKNKTHVRGLPVLIGNLLTTVDQTGGYYQQCEETDLRPDDQAVVIGEGGRVAQGVVTIQHVGQLRFISVGSVCYSFWRTDTTIFKYVH